MSPILSSLVRDSKSLATKSLATSVLIAQKYQDSVAKRFYAQKQKSNSAVNAAHASLPKSAISYQIEKYDSKSKILPPAKIISERSEDLWNFLKKEAEAGDLESIEMIKSIKEFRDKEADILIIEGQMPKDTESTKPNQSINPDVHLTAKYNTAVNPSNVNHIMKIYKTIQQEKPNIDFIQSIYCLTGFVPLNRITNQDDRTTPLTIGQRVTNQIIHKDGYVTQKDSQPYNPIAANTLFANLSTNNPLVSTVFFHDLTVLKILLQKDPELFKILQQPLFITPPEEFAHPIIAKNDRGGYNFFYSATTIDSKISDEKTYEKAVKALYEFNQTLIQAEKEDSFSIVLQANKEIVFFRNEPLFHHRKSDLPQESEHIPNSRFVLSLCAKLDDQQKQESR